jgi:hypothetical protein
MWLTFRLLYRLITQSALSAFFLISDRRYRIESLNPVASSEKTVHNYRTRYIYTFNISSQIRILMFSTYLYICYINAGFKIDS